MKTFIALANRRASECDIPSTTRKLVNYRHFSPIATNWFQGSALEPTELQALPADATIIRSRPSLQCKAEPREQCIPRRSQGTRIKNRGHEREVANCHLFSLACASCYGSFLPAARISELPIRNVSGRAQALRFRRSRRGLSLLEVVLALTILAVAAALLAQITKQATDNGLMAQKLSTAQMLCESKMSEVLAGAIPLTSTSWTQITDSGRRGSWYYQIQTVTAQRPNMIGVRLSVTDSPEATTYNPELFFIVRWMIDPSLGLDTLPAADASTTGTGSTSSGTSSGGNASGSAGGFQ